MARFTDYSLAEEKGGGGFPEVRRGDAACNNFDGWWNLSSVSAEYFKWRLLVIQIFLFVGSRIKITRIYFVGNFGVVRTWKEICLWIFLFYLLPETMHLLVWLICVFWKTIHFVQGRGRNEFSQFGFFVSGVVFVLLIISARGFLFIFAGSFEFKYGCGRVDTFLFAPVKTIVLSVSVRWCSNFRLLLLKLIRFEMDPFFGIKIRRMFQK